MSIVEQCNDIKEDLAHLKYLKANHEEASALGADLEKLENLQKQLRQQVNALQLFRHQNVSVTNLPEGEITATVVKALAEKFKLKPQRQALVQGEEWKNLMTHLPIVASQVGTCVKNAWNEYVKVTFGGEGPETLNARVARTDSNARLLEEYRTAYAIFMDLTQSVPTEPGGFDVVRGQAKKLADIVNKIDFNVPAEVKKFLDAVRFSGASLNLLTEEVLTWLDAQNLKSQYVIRKR